MDEPMTKKSSATRTGSGQPPPVKVMNPRAKETTRAADEKSLRARSTPTARMAKYASTMTMTSTAYFPIDAQGPAATTPSEKKPRYRKPTDAQ